MQQEKPPHDELMTTAEVARAFRVDPKTVGTWAKAGRLGEVFRTPGGHNRYRRAEVEKRLQPGSGQ